jgi:aryl-alcohol dehydrogenase-like predicted oxidoreductase
VTRSEGAVGLALGTVQFGLNYGIAGRGNAVPEDEVRAILEFAYSSGVRWLDTAAAYGNIEERLAALAGGLAFAIVSKLPPRPDNISGPAIRSWTCDMVERAHERLGVSLKALLFHRAEDLWGDGGTVAWMAATEAASRHGIPLGVSCYDAGTLQRLAERFPLAIAQLPGNALDQSITAMHLPAVPIHLRSIFLQGLLLMDQGEAVRRLPAAAAALQRWHAWCADHRLPPLRAALSIARHLPVSQCVLGVDSLTQLRAIVQAWGEAVPLAAPELAIADPAVVDPRVWQVAAP